MDWQPIETAPKDGTRVLIASGTDVVLAFFDNNAGMWCENEYDNLWWGPTDTARYDGPTHWMPLPAPPHPNT